MELVIVMAMASQTMHVLDGNTEDVWDLWRPRDCGSRRYWWRWSHWSESIIIDCEQYEGYVDNNLDTDILIFDIITIATNANGAAGVFAADMDNDGDVDIVTASTEDNTIAWYENDGASDPSWSHSNISTSITDATGVFAADMDGDGDMDIISASNNNTIAWYENDGASDPSWSHSNINTGQTGIGCFCCRHRWWWRYGYSICCWRYWHQVQDELDGLRMMGSRSFMAS